MMYEVVGKMHLEGKSRKTGNDYSLNIIYVVFESDRKGLVGRECKDMLCTDELYDTISVNDSFDTMLYDGRGNLCEIR